MRRVLIVSPHFPPINAPDHQRVRMLLPYLRDAGWQPHVLAVAPEYVEGIADSLLRETIPQDIEVSSVRAVPQRLTRAFGWAGLGWRSLPFLSRAGSRLLRSGQFDLVLFSSTVFTTFALGPIWRRRYGIPYVLDFQDPWLTDYYQSTGEAPPGGSLKFGVSQLFARTFEGSAVREAAHIVSVSSQYVDTLRARYRLGELPGFTVMPFGYSPLDFELLERKQVRQQIVPTDGSTTALVYAGRCGTDMHFAVRALFAGLAELLQQEPDLAARLRLYFVGSNYDIHDRSQRIADIAAMHGLSPLVVDHPQRVSFHETLRLLLDSAGVLVFGSDDPGYSPSKLYPVLASHKPIIALTPPGSAADSLLSGFGGTTIIRLEPAAKPNEAVARVLPALQRFLREGIKTQTHPRAELEERYSAPALARKLGAIFDGCLRQ